jgi:hypothetical protein
MREYQVRICERLGVKLPGPTRHQHNIGYLPFKSSVTRHSKLNDNNKPNLVEAFFAKRETPVDAQVQPFRHLASGIWVIFGQAAMYLGGVLDIAAGKHLMGCPTPEVNTTGFQGLLRSGASTPYRGLRLEALLRHPSVTAGASHHCSDQGRSTTSNAQVDRCWRCSCR